MTEMLDNPIWHALTGPHTRFAIGAGEARRYPADVSVFAAIKQASAAAYIDLAATVSPDQEIVLFRQTQEPVPAGWESILSKELVQMTLPPGAALPNPRPAEQFAVPLSVKDADDMMALVELTQPGPFAPRTVELGGYFGIRDENGRLIAMAGERLRLEGLTELSAICVHPDAQGKGLGAAMTRLVARRVIARGETPILHAWPENPACALYAKIGFQLRRRLWVLCWRRTG